MKFSTLLLPAAVFTWHPKLLMAQDLPKSYVRSMNGANDVFNIGRSLSRVSSQNNRKIDKAKIQMLQSYSTVMSSNEESVLFPDETGACEIGFSDDPTAPTPTPCMAHPLVVSYLGTSSSDTMIGTAFDVYAAISRDMGATWKVKNLSNNALREFEYSGKCPAGHGGDDHGEHLRALDEDDPDFVTFEYPNDASKPMLVAKGNMILVAWTSKACRGGQESQQDDDIDDPYLVKGSQGCHDYGIGMKFGKSTVPFSCVWSARGFVDDDGTIEWTKPERLTSGRRDAYQLFAAASGDKKAWGFVWQEDPDGLRPGEQKGPGEGMSGATVNHGTDIWYSYIQGKDFSKRSPNVGVNSTEESNFFTAEVRFSKPIPITNNRACPMNEALDGTKGPPICEMIYNTTKEYKTFTIDEEEKSFVVKDGVPLRGNTGASRPVLFFLPTTEGSKQPELIVAHEESKGAGFGGEDGKTVPEVDPSTAREDWGKNVLYHHFALFNDVEAEAMSAGTILNLPELDEERQPIVGADGTLLYQNARRVRIIAQPKSKMGESELNVVALWREGPEGSGKNADIMFRRAIGGASADKFECTKWRKHPVKDAEEVCIEGVQNLSKNNSISLLNEAPVSPYDDSRAHRGFLRGDMLVIGYTHTDVWGRSNGEGKGPPYDFFIRRSFDGGKKFTDFNGNPEDPINLSKITELGHRGHSVEEPRLYGTPGTIKQVVDGEKVVVDPSDVQNLMVWYVAYGTVDYDSEGNKFPMDLYWTRTDNFGESYLEVLNPYTETLGYPVLRRVTGGDGPRGAFEAAQIRTEPSGTNLYATYQASYDDGGAGSGSGSPCQGNNFGNGVCHNNTVGKMTVPLNRYDINNDGYVDVLDLEIIKKKSSEYHASAMDLNGDGKVDGKDVKLIEEAIKEFDKLLIEAGTLIVRRRTLNVDDDDHPNLRGPPQRQLVKCIKKGTYCPVDSENCCGQSICVDNVCCLGLGISGCDEDEDCCSDLECDTDASICVLPGGTANPESRPCNIHGEFCDDKNDCCGDMKYDCQDNTCCMEEDCQEGCTFHYHCCGSKTCEDSKCAQPGTHYLCEADRKCNPKSKPCDTDSDPPDLPCCSSKLVCEAYKCCLPKGVNGCDNDLDCCSGGLVCDGSTSTCCLPLNVNGCTDTNDCCPGLYCDGIISTCVDPVRL